MHSLVKESPQKITWLSSVQGKMKYWHHLCPRLETYLRYGVAEDGTMPQRQFLPAVVQLCTLFKLFNLTEINLFVFIHSKQVNTLDIEEARKSTPNTFSIKIFITLCINTIIKLIPIKKNVLTWIMVKVEEEKL